MENITMAFNCTIDEGNCTEEPYMPYSDRPETYILPIIFSFILIIGVTGNGILVLTILRHANMRNVPNTYVLSLALGDLLVIVTCVPFTITVYVLDSWPFGLLLCKVSECAKDVSIGVSVFTLTALSADRFFAIVDPMRKLHTSGTGRRATRFTSCIAALIWCLAGICALPATFSYIRIFRVNKDVTFKTCYPFPEEFGPNYPKIVLLCRFIVYYFLPLTIIGVFYLSMARHLVQSTRNIPGEMQGQVKQIKARKKVAKMVLAFVIIFAICFLPQHVFMFWFYNNPDAQKDYNSFWHLFRIVGFCLAFANSCINPIALYLVSGSFRKYFKRYLSCCCRSKAIQRNTTMGSRRRELSLSVTTSRRHNSSRRCNQSFIQMATWQTPAGQILDRSQPDQDTTTTACNNGLEQRI